MQQSSQAQTVLRTYSPMASHHCSMVQVNTEHPKVSFHVKLEQFSPQKKRLAVQKVLVAADSVLQLFVLSLLCLQGGVSVSYPQSKVVTGVGGEANYCCMVPPPSHHSSCHPPSCTNLSAPGWSAQYWRCLEGWSDDTVVPVWTHIRTYTYWTLTPFFTIPHLFSPTSNFFLIMPTGHNVNTITSMYTQTTHSHSHT